MFGLETASRFLEKWNTSFKENVIKEAKTLNPSAFLLQLLKSAEKTMETTIMKVKVLESSPKKMLDVNLYL